MHNGYSKKVIWNATDVKNACFGRANYVGLDTRKQH